MRHHDPFPDAAAIAHIGERLLDRTLPKARWTHAGHFAAAIWILSSRPDMTAARDLPDIIRAYNISTGGENTDTAGYHETITQASLAAARHHLKTNAGIALHIVCNSLLASAYGDPDWLLAHWSRAKLFSVAARRHWCPPDLRDLPFQIDLAVP